MKKKKFLFKSWFLLNFFRFRWWHLWISILLIGGIWISTFVEGRKNFFNKECPFCDRLIAEKQTVYHGEDVSVVVTHKPVVPGHLLVIPKRHVERFEDLSDQELCEMKRMIQKVNAASESLYGTTSYFLMQKNGLEAGQSVPHVHIHYFPRTFQESHWTFALRLFITSWMKPISHEEMAARIAEYPE